MSAGKTNFILFQGSNQETCCLSFTDKWYRKPAKFVDKILLKVIVISFSTVLFVNLLTYAKHCLLSYTR